MLNAFLAAIGLRRHCGDVRGATVDEANVDSCAHRMLDLVGPFKYCENDESSISLGIAAFGMIVAEES